MLKLVTIISSLVTAVIMGFLNLGGGVWNMISGEQPEQRAFEQIKTEQVALDLAQEDPSEVLGISIAGRRLAINAPVKFNRQLTVAEDAEIIGNLRLGGRLIGPNIVTGLIAEDGVSVTGVGELTLVNTDKGSDQQIFKKVKVGDEEIEAGGNDATLELAAGDNINLDSDKVNKKITISSSFPVQAWTDIGAQVYLSTLTDKVGIGTSNPLFNLEVAGTAALRGASGQTGLVVSSGGLVGIGTATPDKTLTINSGESDDSGVKLVQLTSSSPVGVGGGKVLSVDNAGNVILVTDETGGTPTLEGMLPGGSTGATIYYDGTTWAHSTNLFHDGGSVGISTLDPQGRLHLYTNDANTIGAVFQGTTGQSSNLTEWRDGDGTTLSYIDANGVFNGSFGTIDASGGSIDLGFTQGSVLFQGADGITQDNGNLFWDDANNRLGIGTGSPSYELHVVGDVNFTGELNANGDPGESGEILVSGGDGTTPVWQSLSTTLDGSYLKVDGTNFASVIVPDGQYLGIDQIRARDSGGLALYDDGGNGIFVEDGGNVGIGVTDSATKLHIVGTTTQLRLAYDATNYTNLTVGSDGSLVIAPKGTTALTLSDTQATFSVPTAFNAAGDVGVAYDIEFANTTAGSIKSKAPLYIVAGQSFDSSDLTLRTYNEGDLVLDLAGGMTLAQAQEWDLASSTSALNIGGGLLNLDSVNGRVGVGTDTPGYELDLVGSLNITGALNINSDSGELGEIMVSQGSGVAPVWQTLSATLDGSYLLTDFTNFTSVIIPDGQYLGIDQLRARDGDGLALYDDGGNGIFVEDGGNVGIGVADPGAKLDIVPINTDNAKAINLSLSADTDGDDVYGLYLALDNGTGTSNTRNSYGIYSEQTNNTIRSTSYSMFNKITQTTDGSSVTLSSKANGVHNDITANSNYGFTTGYRNNFSVSGNNVVTYGFSNSSVNITASDYTHHGLFNNFYTSNSINNAALYGVFNWNTYYGTNTTEYGLYNNLTATDGVSSNQTLYGTYTNLQALNGTSSLYGHYVRGGYSTANSTLYGLYVDIDDPDSTNYSIYIEDGSGQSYFGSALNLASTLGVAGTATFTGLADFNGDISIADTSMVFDGASTNFDLTGNLTINTDDLVIEKATGDIGIGVADPTAKLDIVSINTDNAKAINLAVSADTDGDEIFGVYNTLNSGTGGSNRDMWAYQNQISMDGTGIQTVGYYNNVASRAGSGAYFYGLWNTDLGSLADTVNSSYIFGMRNQFAPTGTGNTVYGSYNSFFNNGSGNTIYGTHNVLFDFTNGSNSTFYGTYSSLSLKGSTGYGTYIDDGDSTSGTAYGLYVDLDDPNTTNYSIYIAGGSGQSYFGSAVNLADTLSVTGTTTLGALDANGDLSIADTSIVFDGASTNFDLTGNLTFNSDDLVIEKATGDIGIGVADPTAKLDIVSINADNAKAINLAVSADTNGDDVYGLYTTINNGTGSYTSARNAYGIYNDLTSNAIRSSGYSYPTGMVNKITQTTDGTSSNNYSMAVGVNNLLYQDSNYASSYGYMNSLMSQTADNSTLFGLINGFGAGAPYSTGNNYTSKGVYNGFFGSGTSNTFYGAHNPFQITGENSVAYGTFNDIYLGPGASTTLTGYGTYNELFSSSSNGTGYGTYIIDDNTSTDGTFYGLYVDLDDPDTTNYSIYVEPGSGISYFGSNVGIGTSDPGSYGLNVAGTGYFGGNVDINSTITLNTNGTIFGAGVANKTAASNALVSTATTGTVISRDVADANTALTIEQTNAGSTGDILQLKNSTGVVGVFDQEGNLGLGVDSPEERLHVAGNVVLGAQTDAAGSWSKISQATAGTVANGGTSAIETIRSMAVYNGSLYIGTAESNAAEVYRWDGGSDWTRVSFGAGTIDDGGTSGVDAVTRMAVYNGKLYIGTEQTNAAEVYVYEGGTDWTAVNSTAGQFVSGDTSGINDVSSMSVHNGALYIGTWEVDLAEVYRYDGATWSKVSQATAGTIASGGTALVDRITSLASYDGNLYAGTSETDAAEVYRYDGGTGWTRVSFGAGTIGDAGGALSGIDGVRNMAVYNGSLYIGTAKDGDAQVYRYDGGTSWSPLGTGVAGEFESGGEQFDKIHSMSVYKNQLYIGTDDVDDTVIFRYDGGNTWTRVTDAVDGTIIDGDTTAITEIRSMVVYDGALIAGTAKTDGAEVYRYTATAGQSYGLKFRGASGEVAQESGFTNEGEISFIGWQQSDSNRGNMGTGQFVFSHGITTATGAYDVAEDYPTRETNLMAGEILAVDGNEAGMVKRASKGDEAKVVGILSSNPALRLSQSESEGTEMVPVALAGRVEVKVASNSAEIKPGDGLALSETSGRATKLTKAGYIVGRALEGWKCSETDCPESVMVMVGNTFWIGELTGSGELAQQEENALERVLGLAAPWEDTQSLERMDKLEAQLAVLDSRNQQMAGEILGLTDQVASMAARLEGENEMKEMEEEIGELEEVGEKVEIDENLDLVQGLALQEQQEATVSADLRVLGKSTLGETSIIGNLKVGLLWFEDIAASIEAPVALKLQPTGLAGIEMVGGKIRIDKKGNLTVLGDVVIEEGRLVGNESFRGSEEVGPGVNRVLIERTWKEVPESVVVTPSYETSVWVTNKSETGFEIHLGTPALRDETIDWVAVW